RRGLHGAQRGEVEGIVAGRGLQLDAFHGAVAQDAEVDGRLDAAAERRARPLRANEEQHAVEVVAVGEGGVVDAADGGGERRVGAAGGGALRTGWTGGRSRRRRRGRRRRARRSRRLVGRLGGLGLGRGGGLRARATLRVRRGSAA